MLDERCAWDQQYVGGPDIGMAMEQAPRACSWCWAEPDTSAWALTGNSWNQGPRTRRRGGGTCYRYRCNFDPERPAFLCATYMKCGKCQMREVPVDILEVG